MTTISTRSTELVDQIANDFTLGAVGSVRALVEALRAFADEYEVSATTSTHQPSETLLAIGRQLLEAQTSLAPIVNLLSKVLFAAGATATQQEKANAIRNTAQAFADTVADRNRALQRKAAALLPTGVIVLTHSRSSVVLHTLRLAQERGRRISVIVTETRPFMQGRQLAAELAAAGIQVRVIVDGAVPRHIRDAEMVVLPVDTMCIKGLVGRTGTAAIAAAATRQDVPTYAVADTTKIWPHALGPVPILPRPADDSWPDVPEGVEVHYEAFDMTPWNALAGIVTEKGLMMPDEIQHISEDMSGHPALIELVSKLGLVVE